ncbi:Cobyric acid synthase [Methylorubrum aminovorans]|uniref:Cobyric acid synthase n=1 Tax=Methylorubrum aminovorans TaxID=269069 RepID=A0ABQ4UHC7_9HYPH|nr:cobyric acid synthase [Methylorubrum aminovorans]GJE65978.1 Cobyric acid synthase [Methylorubrum aminovorans]
MVMGTGTNVGKSTIVAALARAFARRGLSVRPFKPQNMANNAAVTVDGGEIGRAQAVQARAARAHPSVHMNPILLKPETDTIAQVVVQGRAAGKLRASDFLSREKSFLSNVLHSFARLEGEADIVLVEGAGSPAEINLRDGDIANMGFATAAGVPAILVGDIDRGGVIASLVGTHAVLPPEERRLIKGFVINRFRGDRSLFEGGRQAVERLTGWRSLGTLPWMPDALRLPAEDAIGMRTASAAARVKVAVPLIPRIANFDDLDPLAQEEGVDIVFVPPGEAVPTDADLIVLAGSKSTISDLAFLRSQGWHVDLSRHVQRGGRVLGLCGGYQMLGRTVSDPDGLEGPAGTVHGLGLLDVETVLEAAKTTRMVAGRHVLTGSPVAGYEIHQGRTTGPDEHRPFLELDGRPEGATSRNARVSGTYLHGIFAEDSFRSAFLSGFGLASTTRYEAQIESSLDGIADEVERELDLDAILAIARDRPAAKPIDCREHF